MAASREPLQLLLYNFICISRINAELKISFLEKAENFLVAKRLLYICLPNRWTKAPKFK